MSNRYIYMFIAACGAFVSASAQENGSPADGNPISAERRVLEEDAHTWLLTRNAAGLSLYDMSESSVARIGAERSVGKLHLAQEGNSVNTVYFGSDRYSSLGDYLRLYGSFDMKLERENDRAWSDVVDTYNGNPYIYGSGRKGEYEYLEYRLKAKLSSVELGRFTYGIALDYKVADLSRMLDPRPRNVMADYSLIPSATFRVSGKSRIGADVYYRFNKSKLKSIKTVEDDSYLYYDYQGMENVISVSTSTFKRQFIGKHWGYDLQYSLNTGRVNWLTSFGYDARKDEIKDHQHASPGQYKAETYSLTSALRVTAAGGMHSVTFNGSYRDGNADAYTQEYVSETSATGVTSSYYVTVYSALALRNYTTDLSLRYRFYSINDAGDYSWYLGGGTTYYCFHEQYLLPYSSRRMGTYGITVEGGMDFVKKGEHRFSGEAALQGNLRGKNEISLYSSTVISENVLLPDMDYFKSKKAGGQLKLNYTFPIQTRKSKLRGMLSVYGGTMVSGMKDASGDRRMRTAFGLSFGILTM